jgi:hypothetical protein
MATKKIIRITAGSVIACFILWRASLCCGIIQTIPKAWVEYRNNYTRDSGPSILPSGDVRCPLCHRHVKALYGGIAEDYYRDRIYNQAGNKVWKWEGCVLDAFWECERCGKKFDIKGRAIMRFSRSDEKDSWFDNFD